MRYRAVVKKPRKYPKDASKLSDLVNLVHDCGLSVPSRTIFMSDEEGEDGAGAGCDYKMADRFVKNIHVLEELSHDPVTVVVNNPGGDEYHGMAIYDAIKCSPCKVMAVVRGHAMSMGSLILQAASVRVMGPCATQLVHYGTWGVVGEQHQLDYEKWADEGKRIKKWVEQVYLERILEKNPKFSLKELQEMLAHDTFLTATDSIELGLADYVG